MAKIKTRNKSRVLDAHAQERLRLICPLHPLSKFAENGEINDGPCADAVLKFVQDFASTGPESEQHRAAEWFLFKSERAFFFACSEAGIDPGKLRGHLRQRQQLGSEEIDRLVPQWTQSAWRSRDNGIGS